MIMFNMKKFYCCFFQSFKNFSISMNKQMIENKNCRKYNQKFIYHDKKFTLKEFKKQITFESNSPIVFKS